MRKVRILIPIASAEWSYSIGDVVEMPADQAANWISGGIAEAADEPAPVTSAPKKKAK